MRRDKNCFPLQQGDLDYLCSLYAAINLAHLLGRVKDSEEAEDYFNKAIKDISTTRGWRMDRFLTEGINIDPDDFAWILDRLNIMSNKEESPSIVDLVSYANNSKDPLPIYIEATNDKFTHFTLICGKLPNGNLHLYDSYGFREIIVGKDQLSLGEMNITVGAVWHVKKLAS